MCYTRMLTNIAVICLGMVFHISHIATGQDYEESFDSEESQETNILVSASSERTKLYNYIYNESPSYLKQSPTLMSWAQSHANYLAKGGNKHSGRNVWEIQQCNAGSAYGAMYGDSGAVGFKHSKTGHWGIIKSRHKYLGVGVSGGCYVAQFTDR